MHGAVAAPRCPGGKAQQVLTLTGRNRDRGRHHTEGWQSASTIRTATVERRNTPGRTARMTDTEPSVDPAARSTSASGALNAEENHDPESRAAKATRRTTACDGGRARTLRRGPCHFLVPGLRTSGSRVGYAGHVGPPVHRTHGIGGFVKTRTPGRTRARAGASPAPPAARRCRRETASSIRHLEEPLLVGKAA